MKKCPVTIDTPILIFSLEIEDILILGALSAVFAVFFDSFWAGIVFVGGWALFSRLKKDKPEGYIIHFFYKLGFKVRGLIDPLKSVSKYSCLRGDIINE
ncbi:MAG: hypothetical protein HQL30_12625 [Candidatus Omnitrophica bacterium]|nr:hypothetical protein [Candidatus Omnitrophota bacterium]